MNNIIEIIEAIGIALAVATFLLNTDRALKAIDLCKENLVLLNNKALSIKQHYSKLLYGGIYKTMFKAYCLIQDNTSAITYGRRLLVIYCECGETVLEGWVSVALAQIYQSQNKYDEAKELYKRAITFIKETGEKDVEAITYGNLGTVYRSLGEYDKAKEYFEKSLATAIEIGDRAVEAINYRNLGAVFKSLGEYVKAKEYLEKALAITMKIGDRAGEAKTYGNLGTVLKSLGKYIRATGMLQESTCNHN